MTPKIISNPHTAFVDSPIRLPLLWNDTLTRRDRW